MLRGAIVAVDLFLFCFVSPPCALFALKQCRGTITHPPDIMVVTKIAFSQWSKRDILPISLIHPNFRMMPINALNLQENVYSVYKH